MSNHDITSTPHMSSGPDRRRAIWLAAGTAVALTLGAAVAVATRTSDTLPDRAPPDVELAEAIANTPTESATTNPSPDAASSTPPSSGGAGGDRSLAAGVDTEPPTAAHPGPSSTDVPTSAPPEPVEPSPGQSAVGQPGQPDDEAEEGDDFGPDAPAAIEVLADPVIGFTDPGSVWTAIDLASVGSFSPSPCALADATLVATPNTVSLPSETDEVEIAVTWCGTTSTTLSVEPGPGVTPDAKEPLTVEPDQTVAVTLFVDRAGFAVGGFETAIDLVAADGSSVVVPVHGMSFGPFGSAAATGTFTAGGGASGCTTSCITSAQLAPTVGANGASLEATTHTPATFELYLFTNGLMFIDGIPVVAGASPIAQSDPGSTSWSTPLDGLEPETTYRLVIAATDAQGRTQLAAHIFSTPALPPSQFAGNDPDPGCGAGCIVNARLSATSGYHTVDLEVETHTPAKIVAQVGTGISWDDGWPTVTGSITDFTYGQYETSWDTSFEGLEGDTDYHVVVRATDDQGRTDIQAGEFHTSAAPPVSVEVRFEKVLVRWDGDRSTVNRGELRFKWGVDDLQVASRGESKHHTGEQIELDDSSDEWLVSFDGDESHLFTLAGGERDPNGNELCQAQPGENVDGVPRWRWQDFDDCGIKWNTAPMTMTLAEIDDLPWCWEYNIEGASANHKCHDIDTPNYGNDVPRFTSIVSFDVLD